MSPMQVQKSRPEGRLLLSHSTSLSPYARSASTRRLLGKGLGQLMFSIAPAAFAPQAPRPRTS